MLKKIMLKKIISSQIISSQKGAATLLSTVILSAAALMTGFFMIEGKKNIVLSSIKNNLKNEANFISKEGLSLSSFFVANNLVICRKLGWNSIKQKCRWGGDFLEKEIKAKQFNFEIVSKSKDNLVIVKEVKESGMVFQLKLSFNLINTKDSNFILGSVEDMYNKEEADNTSANLLGIAHDKDENMVLINSEVSLLSGSGYFSLTQSQALIRRPLAHISMETSKSNVSCSMSCDGEEGSENPYAECRSQAYVPQEGDGTAAAVSVDLVFKNEGPGLIYSLLAEKTVKRNPTYFGKNKNIITTFQALPAGEQYKLAGSTWSKQDTHDCVSPTIIKNTNKKAGTTNTTTIDSMSVHGSQISSVTYSLLLEGVPTTIATPSKTTFPSFVQSLFFPQAMANSDLQTMDPARLQSLDTLAADESKHVTTTITTTITYIPPH